MQLGYYLMLLMEIIKLNRQNFYISWWHFSLGKYFSDENSISSRKILGVEIELSLVYF